MPSAWIVEAIDVFEDRHLGLPPGCPRPSPDQLGLDGFDEPEHSLAQTLKSVRWALTSDKFEREMMLERQKEGIAKAKEQGKYKGRQPTAKQQADKVLALKSAGVSREKIQEHLGISRASYYRIVSPASA